MPLFPSSNISDSSSVTLPPGPSSSIPQRDEIHWDDDMVVDDPDPIHDQAAFSDSQLYDQSATVSSSLGFPVPCMVHESVTNARRSATSIGTVPSETRILVVSPRTNKVCSLHDALGLCTNSSSASRNQFHNGVHFHMGGDNSSAPPTSAWGQMMQHPWFPATPAANATMNAYTPWPYAFNFPQAHGNGSWFPAFPFWNGTQPTNVATCVGLPVSRL